MTRRQEIEKQIAELRAELYRLQCHVDVPNHILHGSACNLENDGHEWHETTVTHNSMDGITLVHLKWNFEKEEEEIEDE